MEIQTTITIDPTNSLAAMAFVLADQQRVIKQLQEENEVFHKEYKQAIEIDQQQYNELDKQYRESQNAHESYVAQLTKQMEDDLAEYNANLKASADKCEQLSQKIAQQEESLEQQQEVIEASRSLIESYPVWYPCTVGLDDNGTRAVLCEDIVDGPVIIAFIVKEDEIFWDLFNRQCHGGDVAFRGGMVENGCVYGFPDMFQEPTCDQPVTMRCLSFSKYFDQPDIQDLQHAGLKE